MKDFDNIGKRMPYTESNEYINSLIDKGIDIAIARSEKKHNIFGKKLILTAVSVAASVAIMLMIFNYESSTTSTYNKITGAMPLNEVLTSLNDQQVEALDYYSTEIPEYN